MQGDSAAAGHITVWMCLATVGYVVADVAADGLLAEIAKREQDASRGTVQTNVYLVRAVGGIVANLLVGLGMNGREYSGTFSSSLSFSNVCLILAIISAAMVPLSWCGVHETKKVQDPRYFAACWETLTHKCTFYVLLYSLAHTAVGNISTTAEGYVMKTWAQVHNLQAQFSAIMSNFIFIVGLILVKRYMRQMNWRHVIAVTTLILIGVDFIFTYFTVYDVYRNQYFYLGESIVVMVPAAVRFMITSFLVVEVARDGQEGMMYSLLTMMHNLGGPVARALSNQIFAHFDGLADESNYVADTSSFRNTVAMSYGVAYGCSIVALLLLGLIPRQHEQTQNWLNTWPKSPWYGRISIVMTASAWIYAVTLISLAMSPSYSCMKSVGGSGC